MDFQYYNEDPPFDGKGVYDKTFNFNDYLKYNSKDYYSFINDKFDRYSFKEDYSQKDFDNICNTDEYSLKPQQKFAGRIMNPYVENRGILIYHGLGSGKTQTSIVISEAFKFKTISEDTIRGRADTRVLIVVPASLTEQYFSEILGYVTNTGNARSASNEILVMDKRQTYLNVSVRKVINDIVSSINKASDDLIRLQTSGSASSVVINKQMSKVTELRNSLLRTQEIERKKINKVYEILSHDKFLNNLFKNKGAPFKIDEDYVKKIQIPNGLLIIDEAHRLVSMTGTKYRKLLYALRYNASPSFRTVLLTGSPIYDKPFEIGLLLNLLRPRLIFPDNKESFDDIFIENGNMNNIGLFKKMISGYISYFKGGNPKAYPYKKTILVKHTMESYQYDAYKLALQKEVDTDRNQTGKDAESFFEKYIQNQIQDSSDDQTVSSVFNVSRLYCNIVFPEVTSEQERELSRNISKSRLSITTLKMEMFKKILKEVKQSTQTQYDDVLREVKKYSSKFVFIAEMIKKTTGPVFIYSNYLSYGVESLAIVLNALGYSEYFSSKPGDLSYFVWKSEETPERISAAKKAFNSEQNKDGSRLKIILGTPTVMEGVDFKRVRQVHVLDPWWNDARMQQIIARAIRLCSHIGLSEEERVVDVYIHLAAVGYGDRVHRIKYTEDNREKSGIAVQTNQGGYQLVKISDQGKKRDEQASIVQFNTIIPAEFVTQKDTINDSDLFKRVGEWKDLHKISVEEYMYNKAMKKLYINRQFLKCVREASIDCNINKYGNIIRLDEHYEYMNDTAYKVYYENYSTGERYYKPGIKSIENPKLPESYLTLNDILNNVALKTKGNNTFKNIKTNETIQITDDLLMYEDNDCTDGDYSFTGIDENIHDLSVNKELIPYLLKMGKKNIHTYLTDIKDRKTVLEKGNIKTLITYMNKMVNKSNQDKIKKLQEFFPNPDIPWDLEKSENIDSIYKLIFKK